MRIIFHHLLGKQQDEPPGGLTSPGGPGGPGGPCGPGAPILQEQGLPAGPGGPVFPTINRLN